MCDQHPTESHHRAKGSYPQASNEALVARVIPGELTRPGHTAVTASALPPGLPDGCLRPEASRLLCPQDGADAVDGDGALASDEPTVERVTNP
jgi:hypothetical protein